MEGEEPCCPQRGLGETGRDLSLPLLPVGGEAAGVWRLQQVGVSLGVLQGCGGDAGLMLRPLQLNKAHEQYRELEERMEYIRALHELIRNHFSLFSAETEALDISVRRQLRESPLPPGPPPPQARGPDCPLLAPHPPAPGSVGGISV